MIDTDKYTGHTLAEHWDFSIWGITMPTGFDADDIRDSADACERMPQTQCSC